MEKAKKVSSYVKRLQSVKEVILTNIVLLGQTPCLPDKSYERVNYQRVEVFLERLGDALADECTIDAHGNPHAIIKGTALGKPPIVLVAHMDTTHESSKEYHYNITSDYIEGPGIMDNSLGVGMLMSMPDIIRALDLTFESDIILIGLVESLKGSNLKSIRDVMSTWQSPIRGAICVEGGEYGRLDYFSNSMIRAEIICDIPIEIGWENKAGFNAIIVMNEVINNILEIRLPQRPKTNIILGEFFSGFKHGEVPLTSKLGFEIQSDSDDMVEEIYGNIIDICGNVSHKTGVELVTKKISNVKAANLTYHHPLVKSALAVMDELGIEPEFGSSESELSVFLSNKIPAITLGITKGESYHEEDERAEINPIFKGIAQILGVIQAIDEGVCDDYKMA